MYCVRTWASLHAAPAGGLTVSAGEDLLARVGLTEQLRELRTRAVPDKYRFAVRHLPRGAVDSCVSDRRLQSTLRELLAPLPPDFCTGFPRDPGQSERTMKWIAQNAPPANALRQIDLEPVPQSEVAALALSDAPLHLNPLKPRVKHHAVAPVPVPAAPAAPATGVPAPVVPVPVVGVTPPAAAAAVGTKRPLEPSATGIVGATGAATTTAGAMIGGATPGDIAQLPAKRVRL